jgi:pyruvate dehydrogenase E2 component (dihydrolipoamide acetyltransferase)
MAIEIKVPRLGWSMEEGTFIEWLKSDGDFVQSGEPLFTIEGDKAIQDVEAIDSGILSIAATAPKNGDAVKVGATMGFLLAPNESPPITESHRLPGEENLAVVAKPEGADRSSRRDVAVLSAPHGEHRLRISPRASRLAAQLGINCRQIEGTGRSGRIRERDIRAYAERKQPASPSRSGHPTSQATFRRTIAARMTAGVQATAPVTLTTTADATNLVSLRAQFKAAVKSPDEPAPGYADLITKLAARALLEHPALNQQCVDGQITAGDGIHIAIAIDTPAGLVAPVLRDVPSLGVREIVARADELKARARAGQLRPADLAGGTFTITNLGAFGIDAFTPIINVPQCAILGLGRLERRPALIGETIVARDMMTLSLTFDHRVVDGAPAARFLATVRSAIESPGPWLVF